MSGEKSDKPVLLSDLIKKGGKLSSQQLLHKIIVVDGLGKTTLANGKVVDSIQGTTLPLITEINNPVEVTLLEALADLCDMYDYNYTARVIRLVVFYLRVNMCSFKRKRIKEFADAIVSVMVEEIRKNEDKVDSLFKKRGS